MRRSMVRRTALGWSKRSTGPGAVGNGTVGGKKSSTTMSTDQKENSIVVVGSGIGGVMMTCVIFLLFVVEIRIIDLCNIVDLGITSGLIGHDPRDARRLEGVGCGCYSGITVEAEVGDSGLSFRHLSQVESRDLPCLCFFVLFHRKTPMIDDHLCYAMPPTLSPSIGLLLPPQNTHKPADASAVYYLPHSASTALGVHGFAS